MTTIDRATHELEKTFGGRLHLAGSEGFEERAAVTFAGPARTPAAVVRPVDAGEVAAALAVAAEHGLPVAVRAGGHSYARHSVVDGGLVLDLRLMDAVTIDPGTGVGTAQGGVLAGAYTDAAAAYGLASPFGDTGSVGIAGLVLGGGIGFLGRRDGLTVDNLLAAEVVLADGTQVRADAEEHPELFWALRGGGGNFGVVTKLELRLRETPVVTGGMLVLAATPAVVAGALAAASSAPDELSGMINVMKAPPMPFFPPEVHGTPVVMMILCHSGAPADGEAAIAPFRALGTPVADTVAQQPYPALFAGGGPQLAGMFAETRTGFVDLPDEEWAATALGRVLENVPASTVLNLRTMGGAIGRVASDATAFAHRGYGHMLTIASMWPDPAAAASARAWLGGTARDLGLGDAGYVNFMSGAERANVRAAYPEAVLARLARVKGDYDPANVFRSNHNVLPG
ncbi:FAD-binding oxidoreductase [Antribacter gilvus]|uniref:FAD-binding oxidoreductase n=1 Tax=Antribacter gilvus TaxID=2304675 RepID=UPI000F76CB37|nr:FAD-binding oxidoreductase [Antribacter gilvus]